MTGWLDRWIFKRWLGEERGTAVVESALLFPVMISMLMGVYDLGQGIIVNHKAINASQVIGDLITRQDDMLLSEVNNAIAAGRLAFDPYDTAPMGHDIMSVEFDDSSNPVVLWRVTENMSPNNAALDSLEDLARPGEGIVVVTVQYTYTPFFTDFVVDSIPMQEISFLRGRRSLTVLCDDCGG